MPTWLMLTFSVSDSPSPGSWVSSVILETIPYENHRHNQKMCALPAVNWWITMLHSKSFARIIIRLTALTETMCGIPLRQ